MDAERTNGAYHLDENGLRHGNNPAILAKEIGTTSDIEVLARIRERGEDLVKEYIVQGVSLGFVSNVVSEINDALTSRLVALTERRMAEQRLRKPAVPFCWLSFGSDGRREQLLRTDQDNALVYGDPPAGTEETVREYFLNLARETTRALAACGYADCPGNNMACNPTWCQPVSAWKTYFGEWIHRPAEPALLNAAIFFDFRPVCGDFSLASRLRDHISRETASDRKSIILLAKNAVRNPAPLSVWGNFNTEKRGTRRGLFDLKLRCIKTLTDAARVLALDLDVKEVTNTAERFRAVAGVDPTFASFSQEPVMAFEVLARMRVLHGKGGKDGGRYIDIGALNKFEREMLKDAFRSMNRLEELVRVRFQLQSLGLT